MAYTYGEMPYYPQLSLEEFNEALHYFDARYRAASMGAERRQWRLCLQSSFLTGEPQVFASILKPLEDLTRKDGRQDLSELLELLSWGGEGGGMLDAANIDIDSEMNDHEALYSSTSNASTTPKIRERGSVDLGEVLPGYVEAAKVPFVVYEIHYNYTYRMPVLWFSLHDLPPCDKAWDLETIFRYVVPDHYKKQLRDRGIGSILSCEPNPLTSVPSFFVHPCQMQEAMAPWVLECTLKDYIQRWLGLTGPFVGLQVPLAMAAMTF